MAAILNEGTQYLDASGKPLVAGKVYIGLVNTDPVANAKPIFSDRELSSALVNPQILDGFGRSTNKIWTGGKYSIQVNDSADVQQFQDLDVGETTTGATSISLDSVVGSNTITASGGITAYTSNQQFVFVAALANTGAVTLNVDSIGAKPIVRNLSNPLVTGDFAAGASIIVIYNAGNDNFEWVNQLVPLTIRSITPQARLTLTSGVPVISSDVASASTVYCTPYQGNLMLFYDGAKFVPEEFSELSLALVSQHTANGIFDIFAFKDGSTQRIGTGPVWTTITAGSGARGTGPATTQIEQVNGIWVNSVAITLRNSTTTFAVDANKATYLGSIHIDAVAGQVTCHTSYGQSRKCGVWNAYNRVRIILKAGTSTTSWIYTTATLRVAGGDNGNSLIVFSGLAEEIFDIKLHSRFYNNTANVVANNGIGWNSTSTLSGYGDLNATPAITQKTNLRSVYVNAPDLGTNGVFMLESSVASGASTWFGLEADFIMTAEWTG